MADRKPRGEAALLATRTTGGRAAAASTARSVVPTLAAHSTSRKPPTSAQTPQRPAGPHSTITTVAMAGAGAAAAAGGIIISAPQVVRCHRPVVHSFLARHRHLLAPRCHPYLSLMLTLQLEGFGKRGVVGGSCTLRGMGASSIEPDAFTAVASELSTLDVSNNALTALGCITTLDGLKELRANDNKLASADGLSRYAAALLQRAHARAHTAAELDAFIS
ncbi:hypothetical protein EON66_10025 [archaeon]|nr:MAG: hypothetical protein EON66_10025 [archaeon]